jgi:GAF domain-containing protein
MINLTESIQVKRYRVLIDTILGLAGGLLVPVLVTLLVIYLHQEPINLSGFFSTQMKNPFLWVIDVTPLWVGLLGFTVGKRSAQIDRMKVILEQANRDKDQIAEQIENLQVSHEKKILKQLTELKAAAQVGRAAASIHDQKQLLAEVVELISNQFGFSHAGIFLIDEANEYAILQAASSEGGKQMLARGHKLSLGIQGIVGYVAEKGEPRIALDVGKDAVFFNNPDLPQTRSEIALPLKTSVEIIGVLDVQSNEPSAFSDEDVEVLQLLADQVTLAIQNTRLLNESRSAVQELENLYKEQVRRDWDKKLSHKTMAYRYNRLGVEPVLPTQLGFLFQNQENNQLEMPLRLRGEQLGTIILRRDSNQPAWSEDERSLVEEAAGQVGAALENARLFEDAQSRIAREQALSQLTAQFTRAVNLDTLLKKAAKELGQLPHVAEVSIQIGLTPKEN